MKNHSNNQLHLGKTETVRILRIAIPTPLFSLFDYLPNEASSGKTFISGQQVEVSFGRQKLMGILIHVSANSTVALNRLKKITKVVDKTPLLTKECINLATWAATYYQHPLGEVCAAMLPSLLRNGKRPDKKPNWNFQLTPLGLSQSADQFTRSPKQKQLWQLLEQHPSGLSSNQLSQLTTHWRAPVTALIKKNWVKKIIADKPTLPIPSEKAPPLNPQQQKAVNAISQGLSAFCISLLDGITGSGKTEVYMALASQVIAKQQQILILVPEIGLTPQLVGRFQARFNQPVFNLHSGLNDNERAMAWLQTGKDSPAIIIGTRSAIFVPAANLGLIIIDEEHDSSFKQQDGFRYHARDLAIIRAKQQNIPIILGTATPSLETLHNAQQGRYQHFTLSKRAGESQPPSVNIIDIRKSPMTEGISTQMFEAIGHHLGKNNQVMLFLNRRGYATTLMCHDCGWTAKCQRCNTNKTLHHRSQTLRCHHCNSQTRKPVACPECASKELYDYGQGTERIELMLAARYPEAEILRIDRDSTRRKNSLAKLLKRASTGSNQILIGTQMVTKGHHFPNVTLVGVLDADHGLHGADLRASERMIQLITQVTGRAGREKKRGEVIIQTHHPDHPLLTSLIQQGYPSSATMLLKERQEALLPPFSYMAILRSEALDERLAEQFLGEAAQQLKNQSPTGVEIYGPMPSPIEKRQGRYRFQLIFMSPQRRQLQPIMTTLIPHLNQLPTARKVRWSIDIDPTETV